MTDTERIAVLESKVAELESDISEAYADLDSRIEQITKARAENIAVFGIAAAIIIGVIQILISLVK
ncbi:MAG: HalX domain-containing protein [Synergistaceae bacterium]|nr:HalX domain-containing protein [Synergistaceae bacterium]MBQ6002339.1 HalX domain-containing protein [Synergistaceae bacterium]MBR0278496.1 HalX domain-containing protein [Synergistaceae bacterium]